MEQVDRIRCSTCGSLQRPRIRARIADEQIFFSLFAGEQCIGTRADILGGSHARGAARSSMAPGGANETVEGHVHSSDQKTAIVIRRFDPARDTAGLRECVIAQQNVHRDIERSWPTGDSIAGDYLAYLD